MSWADPTEFKVTTAVEKGGAYVLPAADGRIVWFVHPFDYLLQLGKGRLPFESSMNAGMRELERDRRKRP